ncbi:polysaccharide deacetylase family protein [Cryptosporangium aurantiacum]|uniref:Peptidoglycan/xylan/chitin deacetylase, PgdA/CDA1 family n=1 Tax=Cryptosporangium aurantiacum TaxID=134849 RepID=A0A1M7REF8_9ACTN|nr:polysaccharide deacetylase family protein [Cryptosporangium aurantiacum]SHN44697.1 Peptidoglycan/xylan/chitin deacetylase, PgdA/CDA1 family [Cryptosporangium aurantiacum]
MSRRARPSRELRIPVARARRPLHRMVGALLAVLLAAACTPGEQDDPRFRLAAPPDCATNAYCGQGLADVYGVDVSGALVPKDRLADSVAALRDGEVDAAVVFSSSPYAHDQKLVVLEDDRGMNAVQNIVPVFRTSLLEVFGASLRTELNTLSGLITPAALRSLDQAMTDGDNPEDAAQAWLARTAPAPRDVTAVDGPALKIGTVDFLESRVLGRVLAGYLSDRGYRVEVHDLDGQRDVLVDALANGDVDLAPEYVGALLEYLNGGAKEASTALEPTVRRLTEYLRLIGVSPAAAAPATSQNVFVTTEEIAERRGLRALSDLADKGLPRTGGAPRGAPGGEPELAVQVRAVDAQLRLGSTGPEVRDLQVALRGLGYPLQAGGTYDDDTREAVREFQSTHGLRPDGVVGPSTQQALRDPDGTETDPQPVQPGDDGTDDPPGSTSSGRKVFYLTFDDGPSATYTKQILDLLDQYQAKATFFEIGENVAAHPELTREIANRGHAVGNHTWDHPDMRTLSASSLNAEITRTSDALRDALGHDVRCLRPPYGAVNATVRAAIAEHGMRTQLWDIDPQDWSRPGVDAIVRNVLENAHPGAVSLMHDGGGNRTQTVQALGTVLRTLTDRGYTFESLPSCR